MPIIKISSLLTCSFAKAEASVQHVMLVSLFRLFRYFASLSLLIPQFRIPNVYLFLNSENIRISKVRQILTFLPSL